MNPYEIDLETFLMMLTEETNPKNKVKFKVGDKFIDFYDLKWDGDLILEFKYK